MKHAEIAKKCIETAEKTIERDELETVINRLYIASENIAMEILMKVSVIVPKRHDKISNAIENLWKQGKLSANYAALMRDLYNKHLFVDYGKTYSGTMLNASEIEKLLSEVRAFYKEMSVIS